MNPMSHPAARDAASVRRPPRDALRDGHDTLAADPAAGDTWTGAPLDDDAHERASVASRRALRRAAEALVGPVGA